MSGSIYLITNRVNGKCYIGQTKVAVERRWSQHCYNAENGSTYKIHNAIRKYGIDAFLLEVIERPALDQLNERERYWIAELSPAYNMTAGGDGVVGLTPEASKKRSERLSGRVFTAETRRKISEAKQGKILGPQSEETRRKIGEGNRGKVRSLETRAKISAAKKGRTCPPEVREKLRDAAKKDWEKRKKAYANK